MNDNSKKLGYVMLNDKCYRIRYLTPKECGRLMGVPDDKTDKMIEIHSNSALYKQFGNSIVVDVMAKMFQELY